MLDWTTDSDLKWRTLAFGAEVEGDLGAPLSEARVNRLRELLREHGLLIARAQTLSMAQQTALMAWIGPIIRRPQENGYISTETNPVSGRTELTFHADAAYTDAPFAALSLHAVDVVDGASSTRFAHAERGYDTLPSALRAQLDTLKGEMISPALEGVRLRACDERTPAATERMELPAVLVNPRTGRRCIGVSEMHCARLMGMEWEASRALLGAVYDHLYAAENAYEHMWRPGDLLMWDNVTLQHARGSLDGVGRRVLQRVVAGV